MTRLGLLSDTHGNARNLQAALDRFRREQVGVLIHCGDLTEPELAAHLAGFRVIYVQGNTDSGPAQVLAAVRRAGLANYAGQTYSGEIEGVPLAAAHGHQAGPLEAFIQAGRRYVFHGHTHRRRDERLGATRVINPGALGGRRSEPRSIAILDLLTDDLRFIEIPEQGGDEAIRA